MRSRTFVSAALSCLGLCLSLSSIGYAANPKAKKKASSGELSDVSKTLQWEESVMGEDNKRGELDKILKAQAINKAATEKAEREKAKAEANAAKEAAKEAASPKAKKNSEVSIGDLPDEGPSKGSAKAKTTEISPKLETTAAAAPPPPAKPADDKFIDKLLKEDGSSGKRKRASANDDKALQDILAGEEKPKAGGAKGKKKSRGRQPARERRQAARGRHDEGPAQRRRNRPSPRLGRPRRRRPWPCVRPRGAMTA